MRNTLIFTLLALFCISTYSQINTNPEMVLNGGFEEYYACPDYPNQLELAKHWINPTPLATPDFIHRCGNFGSWFVKPKSGTSDSAYMYKQIYSGSGSGSFVFYWLDRFSLVDYREYEEIEILPLEAGKVYEVEFYVKPLNAECYYHAVNNIGAYFSVSMIKQEGFYGTLGYYPHINYTSIVSDTVNHTRIAGEYTAMGGERYLTIGNFFPNHLTDTLLIGEYPPGCFRFGIGYYLLDNVSVKEKMGSSISSNESQENTIRVYPNPATEYVNISGLTERTMYTLTNSLGRVVQTGMLYPNSTQIISTKSLPEGIYILNLNQNHKNINHKILLQY